MLHWGIECEFFVRVYAVFSFFALCFAISENVWIMAIPPVPSGSSATTCAVPDLRRLITADSQY